MSMTRVEKETLLALTKLGKKGGSMDDVMSWRVYERFKTFKTWAKVKPGELRYGVTNHQKAQYLRATERWVKSFCSRGMVQEFYKETRMGKEVLYFGPFYKLTKDGQKLARSMS